MKCTIYRSDQKEMTYLYLAGDKQTEDLPEDLLELLGELTPVMQLDLGDRQALANADIETVRTAVQNEGYYLQMPPSLSVEELIASHFS